MHDLVMDKKNLVKMCLLGFSAASGSQELSTCCDTEAGASLPPPAKHIKPISVHFNKIIIVIIIIIIIAQMTY